MSNWSPEQQITTLKYGAYVTLCGSGMFATSLLDRLAESMQWPVDTVLSVIGVLFAISFMVISIRWTLKSTGLSAGWQQILGIYNEEFAREVNRKANSNSMVAMIMTLLPVYIVGQPEVTAKLEQPIQSFITVGNFAALMLIVGAWVWAVTVLLNLRDEAEA